MSRKMLSSSIRYSSGSRIFSEIFISRSASTRASTTIYSTAFTYTEESPRCAIGWLQEPFGEVIPLVPLVACFAIYDLPSTESLWVVQDSGNISDLDHAAQLVDIYPRAWDVAVDSISRQVIPFVDVNPSVLIGYNVIEKPLP
eukprot:scaffold310627_cov47-Prasinocladus_malaysianus.AAC.1